MEGEWGSECIEGGEEAFKTRAMGDQRQESVLFEGCWLLIVKPLYVRLRDLGFHS